MPDVKKKLPGKEQQGGRQGERRKGRRKGGRRDDRRGMKKVFDKEAWKPKSRLGKQVKAGEVNDMASILDKGAKIMEAEITDALIPELVIDLLLVGQSKGKFGGGSRRIFRQTQKKTKEGNKPKFSTVAAVGNQDGFVGIGYGKSKETVPAREKAIRNAKMNLIKLKRGCGSWQCGCQETHSIPYQVQGKCGSVVITLMPAPKGTGLRIEKECAKILKLAGIQDVWSKTRGKTRTKLNLITACLQALQQIMTMKTREKDLAALGIKEGSTKTKGPSPEEQMKELMEEAEETPKEV